MLYKFHPIKHQKDLKLNQLLLWQNYLKYTFVQSLNTIYKFGHPFKKVINKFESVQRNFTGLICSRSNISHSSYNDRLAKLGLRSLSTAGVGKLRPAKGKSAALEHSHFLNGMRPVKENFAAREHSNVARWMKLYFKNIKCLFCNLV